MLKTASANEVHFCQTRGGSGKECVAVELFCHFARRPGGHCDGGSERGESEGSSEWDWITHTSSCRMRRFRMWRSNPKEHSADAARLGGWFAGVLFENSGESDSRAPSKCVTEKMEGMREREKNEMGLPARRQCTRMTDNKEQDKTAQVASKTAARRFLKRRAPRSCLVRRREFEEAPRFSECGGHSATLSECAGNAVFHASGVFPMTVFLLPQLARARCEDGCLFPRTSGCLETAVEGRAGRKVDKREGREEGRELGCAGRLLRRVQAPTGRGH